MSKHFQLTLNPVFTGAGISGYEPQVHRGRNCSAEFAMHLKIPGRAYNPNFLWPPSPKVRMA